jgi:phage tail-like protein
VARWTFENAWPSKYDGPTLSGKGNEVAIESLEPAHEGLRMSSDDDDEPRR